MSGGYFDYQQYRISDIATEIKHLIESNEDKSVDEYGQIEGRFYSDETIEEFVKAYTVLRMAQIYAQRIDWLVSGDDSEESFHKRLKAELSELSFNVE